MLANATKSFDLRVSANAFLIINNTLYQQIVVVLHLTMELDFSSVSKPT